jgi:hypothetical protein
MKQGELVAQPQYAVTSAAPEGNRHIDESTLFQVLQDLRGPTTGVQPGPREEFASRKTTSLRGQRANDANVRRIVLEERCNQSFELPAQRRVAAKVQGVEYLGNGLATSNVAQVMGNPSQGHVEFDQLAGGERHPSVYEERPHFAEVERQ